MLETQQWTGQGLPLPPRSAQLLQKPRDYVSTWVTAVALWSSGSHPLLMEGLLRQLSVVSENGNVDSPRERLKTSERRKSFCPVGQKQTHRWEWISALGADIWPKITAGEWEAKLEAETGGQVVTALCKSRERGLSSDPAPTLHQQQNSHYHICLPVHSQNTSSIILVLKKTFLLPHVFDLEESTKTYS